MFLQKNGSVDPMEVPINRSVLGDKKLTFNKKKKKKKKIGIENGEELC